LFCAALLFVRLAIFVIAEPYFEGDTANLVGGNIDAVRMCLAQGRYAPCPEAGPLPLFQYIPALIGRSAGLSPSAVLHLLAYLSFLSFVGSVALIFVTLKKRGSEVIALFGALFIITGPTLWYSHSTYAEMAAAFLTLAFTCAGLMRAPGWVLAALFVLAGSTKEVSFPFLLALGVAALLPELVGRWALVKSQLLGLAGGAALNVAVNGAFNYFRFGKFYNVTYLQDFQIVPTWKLHLNFFVGLWFSPNGGILFFWTSFFFVYAALLGLISWRFLKSRKQRRVEGREWPYYLPLGLVSVVLFFLTLGFARWFSPFGWLAWGPRLLFPWIPAAMVVLLHFYGSETETLLRAVLKSRTGLVLTSMALLCASLPQLVVLFSTDILSHIFDPTTKCPRWPPIQHDLPFYYHCLKSYVWPKRITLLEAFPSAVASRALLFSLCYAVILIGSCLWMRGKLVHKQLAKPARN
jgi:hypothetical protein